MFINKTSKGFTIVELIVVIAIVAVLAGIVMTSVTVYISRAKDNAVKANVAQLAKKALAYYSEHSNLTGFTYTEFPGYGLNREPGSSGRFLAYKLLPSSTYIYWGQDASGAKGQIGQPRSTDYTLASAPAVGVCTPACSGTFESCSCSNGSCQSCSSGQVCQNNQCVTQTDYCGGTCANCGSYGSDDLWNGADCGGQECCSAYPDGCYWDGAGCAGLTCSGDSEESCGGNCPGGSNDCTWGG